MEIVMRTVEASIVIHRSPSVVLSAFTEPHHLRAWWGVERALVNLRKGGLYSLAWQVTPEGVGYVTTGVIEEYLPACQLRVGNMVYFNPERPILGPMELLVLVTPENGSTTLTVVQVGYQDGADWDWYYEAVKNAWPEVLVTIKGYVEAL